MAFYSIILILFLSYKISTAYVHQRAGYKTYFGQYYGAQARISAWGVPDMHPNSSYEVSINLLNQNDDSYAMLQTGFHVSPSLYGDNKLRFFISWTSDIKHIPSCYNMDCGSFVVANRSFFVPGQVVAPVSQYNGQDHYITIFIKKDPDTEVWTLYREYDGKTYIKFGWWQKGLVGLDQKATIVEWVGAVTYLNNDTGPVMGSGHFPEEGENKAAYMMDLKLFDPIGNSYNVPNISDQIHIVDKPKCYNIVADSMNLQKFYYGGPAGCKN